MHLCIVLPFDMTARHLLETDFLQALRADGKITKLTLIARTPVCPPGCAYIPLLRPFRYDEARKLTLSRVVGDATFAAGYFLHLSLVCRFNSLCGFEGYANRLKQSRPGRVRELKEGHPASAWLGWPLRKSRSIFDFLYRFYYSAWQRHADVEALFDRERFDGVVLSHLQNHFITPYLLAAKKRGIRIVGINGSWDQPTTKGPLAPFIGDILVQNQQVKQELIVHHGLEASRLKICGWPQMDIYGKPGTFMERGAFLHSLSLSAGTCYILFGAYSERLGSHEPMILEWLADDIEKGTFGENVKLYVRCHPLDSQWEKRLGSLRQYKPIILEPPSLGGLAHLANLLKHSAVTVASAGTIALDAAAVDTPAIALAFEDESLPYYDRPARRHEMEHYAAAIATGGMTKVTSYGALKQSIQAYLNDRTLHASQRKTLRDLFLEPLDGQAARRMAQGVTLGLS